VLRPLRLSKRPKQRSGSQPVNGGLPIRQGGVAARFFMAVSMDRECGIARFELVRNRDREGSVTLPASMD
jgi:hypothetical protein